MAGPHNYCVYFSTVVEMHILVDANSEEEAKDLVQNFSPTIDWNNASKGVFGQEEITVHGVTP